ncbi:NAD-dependent epimerase/dehydratase family protein [Microcystis aeruginosa CS-558/01A06]|uniref:NAD-dependent epimerase/dehydratase family protein n=1 Tax=Microcystis aeruginosa BLCC-F108 TaxID=2755317 RepID=A0A841UWK8_MICAE|nr:MULTISPECIES: hopanoid-associated sugar epimerase [Microcystis]MBC1193284.1 NAD-dependent epimerase/dehydratase family protein [Microcystis aeruginosa BLCC-F108]MCA2590042.1 NAD-dependent epimerase/dehydratase family protein [Microcystis sp. M31BS1]MDB9410226.1 NAD-dependent epimerase/dehydratase family protein [Microcystis aeruginosa CS-558/01A06]
MRAFVTGGTGFIGANLVRLLLVEGYQVRVLVRPQSNLRNLRGLDVEIVRGNLNDENLFKLMVGCEVLFHVAAHYSLWQKDRHQLYQNNVLGTRNVLESAHLAGVARIVYTSSVAAIGVGKKGESVDETYQSPAHQLVGYYKKSKYWAEQEALKAVQRGQDIVIVNPSTPIGAFDLKPTPTGDIILRFLRRKMPAYVNTGLNLIDVRDVAWGHLLALEKGRTGERYILGHQNTSLKTLLTELAEITSINAPKIVLPFWIPLLIAWPDEKVLPVFGKSPSIPLDGVKMSKQSMYYDSSKARQELGLPQSPIRQALADAIDWFQTNGDITY